MKITGISSIVALVLKQATGQKTPSRIEKEILKEMGWNGIRAEEILELLKDTEQIKFLIRDQRGKGKANFDIRITYKNPNRNLAFNDIEFSFDWKYNRVRMGNLPVSSIILDHHIVFQTLFQRIQEMRLLDLSHIQLESDENTPIDEWDGIGPDGGTGLATEIEPDSFLFVFTQKKLEDTIGRLMDEERHYVELASQLTPKELLRLYRRLFSPELGLATSEKKSLEQVITKKFYTKCEPAVIYKAGDDLFHYKNGEMDLFNRPIDIRATVMVLRTLDDLEEAEAMSEKHFYPPEKN